MHEFIMILIEVWVNILKLVWGGSIITAIGVAAYNLYMLHATRDMAKDLYRAIKGPMVIEVDCEELD
jgi:hypothetical protein